MGRGKKIGTVGRKIYMPHPEEIRLAKKELIDYLLRELDQIDGFWRYRYRVIVDRGFGITYRSLQDIGEYDDGIVITYMIEIFLPEEVWKAYALAKKNKLTKLPKPHPIIRQQMREVDDEGAKRVKEALKRLLESGGKEDVGEENG